MRSYLKQFIGGEWVESQGGTRHEVINPATEEAVTEITLGSAADVDQAVAAARKAFESFSRTSVDERVALIEAILAEYKARAGDMAEAISQEMGAPISLARTAQVGSGLGHLMSAANALREFRFEEQIGNSLVVHEPIGVVAMITPWNWPLNQIVSKVAPALAAGCTMVLKPSEEAPRCAMIFAEVLAAAGVPKGVFNLVNGDGPGVGTALSRHKGVDMVSFTGSTRAGVLVAKNAAETVKRVHQELGGKSPSLMLEGADLGRAVQTTLFSVLMNSGQSCIAPTRLLVPKGMQEQVAAAAAEVMKATHTGDPAEEGRHIGPLVNKAQWEKVQGLIARGMEEGAKLEAGGPGRPDGVETGYFVRPTLFSGVRNDMTIAREEIFGPVVTIIPYEDEEDAVRIANDTDYGLSAVVFGDADAVKRVAPQLRAGMVYVNGGQPDPNLPFGGYKQSGNGREHGKFGLAEFMEVKAMVGALA
ncbi:MULTISPECIES: aldehyde dehydrogenase family protein [unclassified Sphingomonas]|uniref:aldehyde dehydrogenase family protein n=1 Tax=Sphingomonas TaxID=13687 RepID=UPI00095F54FC|nr:MULTISPECIES: aldehyde dehydrogenase family protein [unclassified Sphingomonas]MBN8812447.1 aldehyde dehydrogenase family protein [Sphingomonas sp.]OJY52223.1 MAG: aldehyde dehydrogenase family protein [Sphingomonas sp. 67-41]